jgi:hypothetical protein
MRNVLDISRRENQNAHFKLNNVFENRTVYETMWKNISEQGRQQMTIRRTPIACRIHSEYVTLTAFPLQQWLYERASTLRYTYIACLTLLFYFFYQPHCHISCGIPSRCFPSHPDCNAAVYFLFFSCFTLTRIATRTAVNCRSVHKKQNCCHFTAPLSTLRRQHVDDKIN